MYLLTMDTNSIYTVLITLITVLGSTSAWKFYEKRARLKEKTENILMNDCSQRISKLEVLLEKSAKEKDTMRQEILKLTSEVSELRVKVEFLQKENEELHKRKTK
jgi:predicted RNase H-like nuclease (RuvC/YqgF family)